MTISPNCQIGELMRERFPKILRRLERDRFDKNFYFVITTAQEETETLYILTNRELKNGLYDLEQLRVVGIAGSKQEALELVTQMIQSACDVEQLSNLKQYFMEY